MDSFFGSKKTAEETIVRLQLDNFNSKVTVTVKSNCKVYSYS
jgi:hypothetical protein